MSAKIKTLSEELTYHLSSIVRAADAGDGEARKWLASAFPGHRDMLQERWHKRSKSGPVKRQCERMQHNG